MGEHGLGSIRVDPRSEKAHRALGALVSRRRQTIDMIAAEKNRRGFALKPVQKGIEKHICWLERQLVDVFMLARQGGELPPVR